MCVKNTKKEMDETVKEVINRAKQFNIKFNPDKIQYYENEVKYLGLLFSKNGMRPDNDRITEHIRCNKLCQTIYSKFSGTEVTNKGIIKK